MAAEKNTAGKRSVMQSNLVITASVIGIVVLANVLGFWVYGTWDLTDTGRYTLSKVSKDAVRALPDLTVNVYISPDLPPTINLGMGRVLDLRGLRQEFLDKLRQYQSESNGNMTLNIITKDVVKKAKKAKLRLFAGQKAQVSNGMLEFKKYVLGATFQYKNQMEVYPLALEPAFYEYEITKRLLRLHDKYKQSLVMKDVLSAGEKVHKAISQCKDKLDSYKSKKKNQGLASLLSGGKDVDAIRLNLAKIRKTCNGIQEALAKAAALRGKQENLDDVLSSGAKVTKVLNSLYKSLEGGPKAGGQAGLILRQLDATFRDADEDYEALKNSPGRRTIGFICGQQEFCPFPEDHPMINPQLAMMLGSKNPMMSQFITQASQLERRINMINEQLNKVLFRRKGFNIKKIGPNTRIGPDVKALVVFGPEKKLDDKTMYKIDQFLLHGHSVVFFTNNWDAAVYNMQIPKSDFTGRKVSFDDTHLSSRPTNLKDLLSAYGVRLNQDLVVGRKHFGNITVYQVIRQGGYAFQTQRAFPYPLLPTFFNFDTTNPIVRGMADLTMPFVSTVEPTDDLKANKSVTITPLVVMGNEDAAVKGDDVPLSPPMLLRKLPVFQPGTPKPVALLVKGQFTSYFADHPMPKGVNKADFVKTGQGRLLVVGSNMGLENLSPRKVLENFKMSELSGNNMGALFKLPRYAMHFQNWQLRLSQIADTVQKDLVFVDNILEWAVQKTSLAEIRAKGMTKRPISEVSGSARIEIALLLILGLPLLFILFGFFRFAVRRKRIGGLK